MPCFLRSQAQMRRPPCAILRCTSLLPECAELLDTGCHRTQTGDCGKRLDLVLRPHAGRHSVKALRETRKQSCALGTATCICARHGTIAHHTYLISSRFEQRIRKGPTAGARFLRKVWLAVLLVTLVSSGLTLFFASRFVGCIPTLPIANKRV